LRYLSQILFMRSFFSCCASFMKATNFFEGLGIRIVFVVSISICFLVIVPQSYDKYFTAANFQALKNGAPNINGYPGGNVVKDGGTGLPEPSPPSSFYSASLLPVQMLAQPLL
ncbi:MAG: hypothetical protein K2G24_01580, partial [Muribaculaceae bacterium]|nr:hypothetical protein [Muribaculaceae bacterium]